MYRVTALKYGCQYYPGPAIYWFSSWFEWIYLDFYFWLVQSDEHTVLVDVGMSQEHADRANPAIGRAIGEKAHIKITEDPLAVLAREQISPNDVDYVIITHTHLDHVSNVSKFPRATFITSRTGLEWVSAPPYDGLRNPLAVPQDALEFLNKDAKRDGRLRVTDDREEVLPGIVTVRTGGHTVDHQIVLIETERGTVGLIVDNAPTYANLDKNIPVGCPFDIVAATASLELMAREADIVVPGHDPAVTDRFPYGRIA
ncbi:MAG: N-acyl homoserine lactonase family protein [Chloroflexota bacterium]|nr:MAG: hypothetical protein DLM70_03450 [Chloroflexota bacterium]